MVQQICSSKDCFGSWDSLDCHQNMLPNPSAWASAVLILSIDHNYVMSTYHTVYLWLLHVQLPAFSFDFFAFHDFDRIFKSVNHIIPLSISGGPIDVQSPGESSLLLDYPLYASTKRQP
eukprot:scaffold4841_cov121-Skeletonema_dohrnii-CCMP3373.AAC.3